MITSKSTLQRVASDLAKTPSQSYPSRLLSGSSPNSLPLQWLHSNLGTGHNISEHLFVCHSPSHTLISHTEPVVFRLLSILTCQGCVYLYIMLSFSKKLRLCLQDWVWAQLGTLNRGLSVFLTKLWSYLTQCYFLIRILLKKLHTQPKVDYLNYFAASHFCSIIKNGK